MSLLRFELTLCLYAVAAAIPRSKQERKIVHGNSGIEGEGDGEGPPVGAGGGVVGFPLKLVMSG